jgi:hypothetical protein
MEVSAGDAVRSLFTNPPFSSALNDAVLSTVKRCRRMRAGCFWNEEEKLNQKKTRSMRLASLRNPQCQSLSLHLAPDEAAKVHAIDSSTRVCFAGGTILEVSERWQFRLVSWSLSDLTDKKNRHDPCSRCGDFEPTITNQNVEPNSIQRYRRSGTQGAPEGPHRFALVIMW